MIRLKGHENFRQRLILSTLSQKSIRIDDIRSDAESHSVTGLADYEISFLRMLDKMTNGSSVEISHTGTSLVYRPGILIGGQIIHDCPNSRAIGYFLEPFIAVGPFCKNPLKLTLQGITNNNVDVSVDTLRTVLLPQLKRYGIEDGLELKIKKRGAPPLGGGEIYFSCPVIKELKPVIFIDQGLIQRIRGIAYATRVSPKIANRVVESARGILNRYIPDIYIYTDIYKGEESGKSPGYGLTLVAESTTGSLISSECAFQPKSNSQEGDATLLISPPESNLINDYHFPTPEDLGVRVARCLLKEIKVGGCVDGTTQWLSVLYAALSPEDICKIRVGSLSTYTIQYLRDIKLFLNVNFKAEVDNHSVLLTCLGCGFVNVNKKTT